MNKVEELEKKIEDLKKELEGLKGQKKEKYYMPKERRNLSLFNRI